MTLHIELLGGLRALAGERAVNRFRTRKAAALLAYLAYYRDRAHPREVLMELLWPEEPPEVGRQRLRTALASLRRQIQSPGTPLDRVVVAERATLQLDGAAVSTDVAQFEALLQAAGQAERGLERAHYWSAAIELYRGDLLPGFSDAWILPERERLALLREKTLYELARHCERSGDLASALGHARRAVATAPLSEGAHRELIRLLIVAGETEAARRQYQELERVCVQELGAPPPIPPRELTRTNRQATPRSELQVCPPDPEAVLALPTRPSPSDTDRGSTITFLTVERYFLPSFREDAAIAAPDWWTAAQKEVAYHAGQLVRPSEEAVLFAFPRADAALAAAMSLRKSMTEGDCGVGGADVAQPLTPQLPRMALHSGDVAGSEGQYRGPAIDHVGRLLLAGQPGQLLISEATAGLLMESCDRDVRLIALGRYRLRPGDPPERLFHAGVPQSEEEPLPPHAIPAHAPSLPSPLTRFFGREIEIEALIGLLGGSRSDCAARLITLTGPGGGGKTRLALEAARRLPSSHPIRIQFVALADLSEPRWIIDRIRDALQLPRSPHADPREQVIQALTDEPTFLVLDNFEQLLPDGAALIQVLLQRVESLRLLVTSRQRLHVPGELERPVGPLPIPADGSWPDTGEAGGVDRPVRAGRSDPSTINGQLSSLVQFPSVQLFIDRARQARPDFQVTARNAAAIAALCHSLEGIPLAIELAAARSLQMTPARMLAEIEQRFELLVSRKRDLPERHRALRATLDWSYRLLSPPLQQFFARLSVFRGGWTRTAAEAVCEEPAAGDHLALLRSCSLVLLEERETEVRCRLLETVREYTVEQLPPAARAELSSRHAEYFRELAEGAEPNLTGPEQVEWLDRLEAEHDNLRAALAWATQHRPEMGMRLALSLYPFWERCGYFTEGSQWLRRSIQADQGPLSAFRARALAAAARLAWLQGDFASQQLLLEESLSLHRKRRDPAGLASVLNQLALAAVMQGEYERARTQGEEGLQLLRALEPRDTAELVDSLLTLGIVALVQGDFEAVGSYDGESLALSRASGNRRGVAASLQNLGLMLCFSGDPTAAHAPLEESRLLFEEIGDVFGAGRSVYGLAHVARDRGEYAKARSLFEQVIRLAQGLRSQWPILHSLEGLAQTAAAQRLWGRAARVLSAVDALCRAARSPLPACHVGSHDQAAAAARAALGEECFAQAWEEGQRLTLEQAIVVALEEGEFPPSGRNDA